MRAKLLVALMLPLSTSAFAQTAGTIPTDPGTTGVRTVAPITDGAISNPGGLSFGTGAASGVGNAGAPAGSSAIGASQLDFGRTTTGGGVPTSGGGISAGGLGISRSGGGMPSGGAGIGSSAAGVPGTNDEYTNPIYGSGRR